MKKNKYSVKLISFTCLFSGFFVAYLIFLSQNGPKMDSFENSSTTQKTYYYKKEISKSLIGNTFTTVIIGDGPAGRSAGIYCGRMGGRAAIFGKDGGQLMKTGLVENWPGIIGKTGPEIMDILKKQVEMFGTIFIEELITKIDISSWPFKLTSDSGNDYYAFSVILATGANAKTLGCPGEKEYWSKGVTTCAICDGPLFAGKDVIVVGGGDSACTEALQLVDAKVNSVKMLVRTDKMRASTIMKEKVKNSNKIEIIYNAQIKEIIGDGKVVNSALCKISGEEVLIPTSCVFIAIGHNINTELVKDFVKIDPEGLISKKQHSYSTSETGIFCAGDVCNKYKQAGSSSGDGINAAIDAATFLMLSGIDESIINSEEKIWFKTKKNDNECNVICENGICSIKNVEKSKEKINKDKKNNQIIDLNNENELERIKNNGEYFILDVYTDACYYCKKIKNDSLLPYSKEIDSIDIYTINYSNIKNKGPKTPFYNLNSVPFILLYHGKKLVSTFSGYKTLNELKKWIKNKIEK